MRTGTILRLAIAPTIPHMRFALRLSLCRPLPARNGHLLGAREGQLARGSVLGERRSGTERRAPTHAHRRDKLRVRADENIILDDSAVLVGPIVIAHYGAGADVDVLADLAVADVGKMVGLGAGADVARLDLDEV